MSAVALVLLAGVVWWALPLGGGASSPTGAVVPGSVEEPAGKPAPTGKPVVPARATVRSRPPARAFAGSSSGPGTLVRVCEGRNCTGLPQGTPSTIEYEAGQLLTFVLAGKPKQAWAEIRGLPSGAPARHALDPGTLMLFPARIGAGRYVVTLNATFEDAEARWVFALKVTR